MGKGMQRAGRERPAWLVLLFCALLLRAFVPGGYMIGTGAAGATALVICPDSAPELAAHAGHHGKAPGKHRDGPCPFGVLGAPTLAANPPLVAAAVPGPPAPVPVLAPSGIRASLAAPPPPSTGPPASARS
jgi:hypothetical protein